MRTTTKTLIPVLIAFSVLFSMNGNPYFFLNYQDGCVPYVRETKRLDGTSHWVAQLCQDMRLNDAYLTERFGDEGAARILNAIKSMVPEAYSPFAGALRTDEGINATMRRVHQSNLTRLCGGIDGFTCFAAAANVLGMGNISRIPAVTDTADTVNDCVAQASPNLCEVVSCGGARALATVHITTSAAGSGTVRLENVFNIDCSLGEVSAGFAFSNATAGDTSDYIMYHAVLPDNATLSNGDTFTLRIDVTVS